MDHPIRIVALRTGLSPAVLRAWERRYPGIRPDRSDAGRRLYSEPLVRRLELLARLTAEGHRIGDIAGLGMEELSELASAAVPRRPATDEAYGAVGPLDYPGLYRALEEACVGFGRLEIADGMVFPLLRRVKAAVGSGELREMHLRFVESCLRTVLSKFLVPRRGDESRPTAVVASPLDIGQDVGLIAGAIHIDAAGYTPLLLGQGVPAEEIASAARSVNAAAVVVGLSVDSYSLQAYDALCRIRSLAPPTTSLYFGGSMPDRLREDLTEVGISYLHDMRELRRALSEGLAAGA